MRGDGDGWSLSPDGSRHWGRHGAAGLLVRAPLEGAESAVLLQHRAPWSHQGGTWGLPGGARDSHESTVRAAMREAREEAGLTENLLQVRAERVTARALSGWSYTTVVADAAATLSTIRNGESAELRWVPEAEVSGLPLHPGFAVSWELLRAVRVRMVLGDVADRDKLIDAIPRTIELPDGRFGWLPGVAESDSDDPSILTVVVSDDVNGLPELPVNALALATGDLLA
ncbi:NUDIX hydrolase [Antrihabitans sp. YC2-6]|uniref:NUDIX hydrolase n=1 Tax=Antrihabitans sp. YC2-6 TaxID=2799498 RepID=UPI0018F53D3F|nr:NUDIX hydrolase [Antrihabitans sp. YC2-6]MBJ8348559.1 NUDIX hydrolase [Antrihabitans sp. YC2-6]